MNELGITFLGLSFGALGYLVVTFWIAPIMRYREAKHVVLADLIFYANALEWKGSEVQKQLASDRMKANRKSAAELMAVWREVPWLYRCLLVWRKEDPARAASELLGLSNSAEEPQALARISAIEKSLRLPPAISPPPASVPHLR